MAERFAHFAAIDWSGAAGERHKGIAVALCGVGDAPPRLVRPGHRWSRQDILDWLLADLPDDTLVGLDLGISLPFADRGAFFPGWSDSPPDARALWAFVDELCAADPHLAASGFVDHLEASRHFRRHGGREGDLFGGGRGRFRVTERAQEAMGCKPYSNFNLVGAAQVGIEQDDFFPRARERDGKPRTHETFADAAFAAADRPDFGPALGRLKRPKLGLHRRAFLRVYRDRHSITRFHVSAAPWHTYPGCHSAGVIFTKLSKCLQSKVKFQV